MFDKYEISARPQHVSVNTEITEKRAPTDESVRLLSEMERAAFGRLIEKMDLPDNTISGKVFRHINHECLEEKLTAVLLINGKQVVASVMMDADKYKTMFSLRDQIAKQIANQLMPKLVNDVVSRS